MTDPDPSTLLHPHAAPEWAAINAEKREILIPPPETPVEDLLRAGQQVSEQATLLIQAIERGSGGGSPGT
ncbi:MAG: hypothetical protein H0V29_05060 [Thermoleophilaceae bacterium]|nr:hypothetical protein [Thermoleophilaceae bacterium]